MSPEQQTLLRRMTGMKVDDRAPKGGWALGAYLNSCIRCKSNFLGDKRAYHCADCAYEPERDGGTDVNDVREALMGARKWLVRIHQRKDELPPGFLDGCDPKSLADDIARLLSPNTAASATGAQTLP